MSRLLRIGQDVHMWLKVLVREMRGSSGESNEIDGFKDTRCFAAIMDEAERFIWRSHS